MLEDLVRAAHKVDTSEASRFIVGAELELSVALEHELGNLHAELRHEQTHDVVDLREDVQDAVAVRLRHLLQVHNNHILAALKGVLSHGGGRIDAKTGAEAKHEIGIAAVRVTSLEIFVSQ